MSVTHVENMGQEKSQLIGINPPKPPLTSALVSPPMIPFYLLYVYRQDKYQRIKELE